MATKVMTNTVATVQTWVMIYKAVVQMVLLYGSKSWVVIEAMLKVLGGGSNMGWIGGSQGCHIGESRRGGGIGHWWRRPWRRQVCVQ